jgi:hypothetical protein
MATVLFPEDKTNDPKVPSNLSGMPVIVITFDTPNSSQDVMENPIIATNAIIPRNLIVFFIENTPFCDFPSFLTDNHFLAFCPQGAFHNVEICKKQENPSFLHINRNIQQFIDFFNLNIEKIIHNIKIIFSYYDRYFVRSYNPKLIKSEANISVYQSAA